MPLIWVFILDLLATDCQPNNIGKAYAPLFADDVSTRLLSPHQA